AEKLSSENSDYAMVLAPEKTLGPRLTAVVEHLLQEYRLFAEAENSAKLIGAKFYWLGFPDGKLENCVATCLELNKVIRDFNPDLIITHNPEDYISDHRKTSQLVVDAGLWSKVGPLIPEVAPASDSPAIAFMESLVGVNFIPERYIDVSDYFETKRKMLACHVSQGAWLADYGGINNMETIEVSCRYRGIQCGVKYAEGFRIWRGWQTAKPEPVMPF
ncbi:MAG: PIG-L family deacetylase, partial [Clostridia bacterium]